MKCIVCKKHVNKTGEFLYATKRDEAVGVCGKPKSCRDKYNSGVSSLREFLSDGNPDPVQGSSS